MNPARLGLEAGILADAREASLFAGTICITSTLRTSLDNCKVIRLAYIDVFKINCREAIESRVIIKEN